MPSGLNRWGFGFIFTAKDLATPTLRGITNSFRQMEGASDAANKQVTAGLKQLGIGLGLAAAGIAGMAVLGKVTSIAGDFEFQMAAVKEITQASEEEFQRLTDSAFEAGFALTQFSPLEAAEGLRIFAQAGFEAKEAADALIPTLDMAAASIEQLSLDKSAQLAVSGLRLFGFESDKTQFMLDRMAKATLISNLQFKDLPLAIGVAARGILAMNAGLEDTLISLGLVRNIIPTVERASTALATTMEKIATKKTSDAMLRLGVAIDDGTGKFRPFLDIIGDLSVSFSKMTETQKAAWILANFGKRSMAGLLAITKQLETQALKTAESIEEGMGGAIDALREKMDKADGTMEKLRLRLMNTFKGMMSFLKKTVTTVTVIFGEPMLGIFADIFQTFAKGLQSVAIQFAKVDPNLKRFLGGMMLVAFAALTVTGAIVAFAGAAKIMGAIFVGGMTTVLIIFGKVILVIAAVTAAVLILRTIWVKNLAGIRDALQPIVDRVSIAVQAIVMLFQTGGFLTKKLGDELAMDKGLLFFVTKVFMAGRRIIRFFQQLIFSGREAFNELVEIGKPLFDVWMETWGAISELIGEVFLAFGSVTGAVEGNTGSFADFAVFVVKAFANIAKVIIWVMKIAIIPMSSLLINGIRMATKTIGPLIKIVWTFGKILLKALFFPLVLIRDGWSAFGDLIEDFKTIGREFVNFFANMITGALAGIISLITAPLKLIPKHMRPEFVQDLIEKERALSQPINFTTGRGLNQRGQLDETLRGTAELSRPEGQSRAEFAQARVANIFAQRVRGSDAKFEVTVNNQTNVEMDGDIIQQQFDKKKVKDAARRGEVAGMAGIVRVYTGRKARGGGF